MTVTHRRLVTRYGDRWIIAESVAGGWYAVRRADLSDHYRRHGLSTVRCGSDLAVLARHLAEEAQREEAIEARSRLRRVS
jgi:hypothetical protein